MPEFFGEQPMRQAASVSAAKIRWSKSPFYAGRYE
jgi:hypothetical protein